MHVDRPVLTPHEHLDQVRQWCVPAQQPPHSGSCWTDQELPRTPDEIGCCPSIEWTPRCARLAPQTLCRNSHAPLPKWTPCSKCRGTCHWGWLTKSKTTMYNWDDYVKCGESKPTTKTSSRDHVTSTFICPAIRVNWDHSWWTSS